MYIKENNTIEITNEDLQRGILAWDLGHLVSLARVSYDYGLLAEEEAWKYIEFAGKKCRETFACWKEIGKSFLLGQIMSYPGEGELPGSNPLFPAFDGESRKPLGKM